MSEIRRGRINQVQITTVGLFGRPEVNRYPVDSLPFKPFILGAIGLGKTYVQLCNNNGEVHIDATKIAGGKVKSHYHAILSTSGQFDTADSPNFLDHFPQELLKMDIQQRFMGVFGTPYLDVRTL